MYNSKIPASPFSNESYQDRKEWRKIMKNKIRTTIPFHRRIDLEWMLFIDWYYSFMVRIIKKILSVTK